MHIRWAVSADKSSWITLAAEVAPIFQAPDMPNDPGFQAYIDSALSKFHALAAFDVTTGEVLGIISFSRPRNQIIWFAVFGAHRGRGVGEKLLACALEQLDQSETVTVETFREDYAPGEAARGIYRKFGFVDTDTEIFDAHGNPRTKMALFASDQAKHNKGDE